MRMVSVDQTGLRALLKTCADRAESVAGFVGGCPDSPVRKACWEELSSLRDHITLSRQLLDSARSCDEDFYARVGVMMVDFMEQGTRAFERIQRKL